MHQIGQGTLIYDIASPAALTYQAEGAAPVRSLIQSACSSANIAYEETNFLSLRRGPYVVAAGLDESLPDPPHTLTGRFVNLFDADLPIVTSVTLTPGHRALLLDLDRIPGQNPIILAAACKTLGAETLTDGGFRFHAAGPDQTEAAVRLRLDAPPQSVTVSDKPLPPESQVWDAGSSTLLLRFPNSASGHWVTLR